MCVRQIHTHKSWRMRRRMMMFDGWARAGLNKREEICKGVMVGWDGSHCTCACSPAELFTLSCHYVTMGETNEKTMRNGSRWAADQWWPQALLNSWTAYIGIIDITLLTWRLPHWQNSKENGRMVKEANTIIHCRTSGYITKLCEKNLSKMVDEASDKLIINVQLRIQCWNISIKKIKV